MRAGAASSGASARRRGRRSRCRSDARRTAAPWIPGRARNDSLLTMLQYIVRRLGYGFLILLGVNLATFFLFFTVNTPDDMARLNIGGKRVTGEQIEKWKIERGY